VPRQTKADVVSEFRRAQILGAARRAFARHGLTRTTVSHIARTARLAKGTVYLYYRSKDEILHQLLTEDLSTLHEATVPAITRPGPLRDRLRRYLQAMVTFFDENRDFIDQCHFEMTLEMRKKARLQLRELFAAQVDAWTRALEPTSRGRDRNVPFTAQAIVSLAYGLAIQRMKGWARGTIEEEVAAAAALVTDELRSP
jgi:TetR/AcrR family fatty acid metabolism transcriptional regulator